MDESDRARQNLPLVEPQVNIERFPVKVALEKQIGLGSRLVEVVRVEEVSVFGPGTIKDRVCRELSKLAKKGLFSVADGDLRELGCLTQHRDQRLHLLGQDLLVFKLGSEMSNRLVLDAVESCDFTKVDRLDIHLVLFVNADTLCILQILNCVFNHLR